MDNSQRHGGAIDPETGLPQQQAPTRIHHGAHGGAIDPRTGLPSAPTGYQQHSPPQMSQPSQWPARPPMGHQANIPPQVPQQAQWAQQGHVQSWNSGSAVQGQEGAGVLVSRQLRNVEQFEFRSGDQPGGYDIASENYRKTVKVLPTNLKTWNHILTTHTSFRWTFVNFFQKAGWIYEDRSNRRHRDFAGRVCEKPLSDRFLHNEGYLRNLIVQCTDDIFQGPANSTWRRTYIRNVSPLKSRIATWVLDFSNDPESWEDWVIMLLRTVPAAIAMTLCFWEFTTQRVENSSYYAGVPYRFHGDAKVWANPLEDRKPLSLGTNNQVYRMLKPRHLCFLKKPHQDELHGISVREVADWEHVEGKSANLDYLFVAYSAKQFSDRSPEDMMALIRIAERACRAAKLPAFWIGSHCMKDPSELENDVYRIADILRGAQKMVIAIGPPVEARASSPDQTPTDTDTLLRQWGSRMWTFPEVLLSPGDDIIVYTRESPDPPLRISKNQFASRVWNDGDGDGGGDGGTTKDGFPKPIPGYYDAKLSGQLIDHYAGTLSLSRLELAIVLLQCLYARETSEHLPGDQSYALQGLLHLRPRIDRTDSQFQAFARLSLANDSDRLLERYICVLPVSPAQKWYDMADAYGSQLWDIAPTCQVAAICQDDTVVIDGAHGANIRWKSFYYVAFTRNFSWGRWFASIAMEYQFGFFIAAISLFATAAVGRVVNFANILGGLIFLGLYVWIWLSTPRLVRICLGGKLTDVQATLFGFEGYLNAPTVERAIFGGNFNRLSWSTNGSPLSRSYVNNHGERVPLDPTTDPVVRAKLEAAKGATPAPGQMRVFTLVDTYNMEMTLFEAERPPVSIFLCGSEGGMQRAVGCSYDFTTQTMYRETVLRMPTTSLNRMDRTSRFRFGLRRPDKGFKAYAASGKVDGQV
ncbi:hypothetical protein OQA88_13437 [Cercophora sp. LCS_1]